MYNNVLYKDNQGLTYDLPDLDFHWSLIKFCTIKPQARPIKALVQGVGQWDLSAPDNKINGL